MRSELERRRPRRAMRLEEPARAARIGESEGDAERKRELEDPRVRIVHELIEGVLAPVHRQTPLSGLEIRER